MSFASHRTEITPVRFAFYVVTVGSMACFILESPCLLQVGVILLNSFADALVRNSDDPLRDVWTFKRSIGFG